MRIKISNEFTGRATTVNTCRPLTRDKIRLIRKRLCHKECRSGDILGARGRQDDPEAYLEFLERAEAVWAGGDDPWPSPEQAAQFQRTFEILFGSREK
jgi:hypothetical protein